MSYREPGEALELEADTDDLVDKLTLEEKIHLLSGDRPALRELLSEARRYLERAIPAAVLDAHGLPGIRFTDGPRGIVLKESTAFPTPMARGAAFDVELEERIGDAIGVEARVHGANFFGAPCVNLLRHPAWGRAQETYGEDRHHVGELGAALVRGVQRHVMACVKHFAVNSLENSRFWVDVRVDDRVLREEYLAHFERIVDEGVASVMSAYNKLNGEFCGHNSHLLRDILKGDWGFDGFVMSDFVFGVRNAKAGIEGGLDVEMPVTWRFRKLAALVANGEIDVALIDDAARRVVRQQLRFRDVGEPERYEPTAVAGEAHRGLARLAAERSIVLLQNDPATESGSDGDTTALPFDPERVQRLAVIGRLAETPNIGDHGSSQVHPPSVVTVLDGIMSVGRDVGVDVVYDSGASPERAAGVASQADAVVVVAGTTYKQEGEWIGFVGGDRPSLRLPRGQEDLIRAVAAANDRCAVVLEGGSAFVTEAWREQVAAIVMAWYPGMEGGYAVADVLFGRVNPAGRLPCTWPQTEDDLPAHPRWTRSIEYGPNIGYRHFAAHGYTPAFEFGHGLSYTTFGYGTFELEAGAVVVDVTNTGRRAGDRVVLVFVRGGGADPVRLAGFTRVSLAAGAIETVRVPIDPRLGATVADPDSEIWLR